MQFHVNQISLDFQLERHNFNSEQKQQWLDRLRDDFNERIDNNQLLKYLLDLSRAQIQSLLENPIRGLEDVFGSMSQQEVNALQIRLELLATILISDVEEYERFHRARQNEPHLAQRFDHAYFGDYNLVLVFDEYEE